MSTEFKGLFSLVSIHGRLVQARTDGELHASQDTQFRGEEETWELHAVAGTNKVALRNYRNKKWLCGEPAGKAVADRPNLAQWEHWDLIKTSPNKFSLRSVHGLYLCAQPPGQYTCHGGEVIADRKELAAWEQFDMIPESVPVHREEIKWGWGATTTTSTSSPSSVPYYVQLETKED